MSQISQTSTTEKSSPYIRHISFINIIKKTKRTFLSVVAVMISVAIIYTSLNLFLNVYQITKTETTPDQGNYHYIIQSAIVDAPNRQLIAIDDNTNQYSTINDQVVNIRSAKENTYLPITITSGSYPQNEKEIAIPAQLGKQLGYNIGDKIVLDISTADYNPNDLLGIATKIDSQKEEVTYTISGFYHASNTFKKVAGDVICFYTDQDVENDLHTIYVYDTTIQYSDSVTFTASYFEIDENDVVVNSTTVDYDTIRNYLQDTTTLLFMFVFIVILAFLISIISLKNVFITSDKDRKKEFGLLKSIGATKNDLKRLLIIELSALGLIGAMLGVVLGGLVSYIVIKLFTKQLSIILTAKMILNPYILLFAFIVGFLMILIIGFQSYRPYLTSNPIDDLKENTYNYDPPVQKPSYTAKSFSWKMFLIYNNRLKAQTRNIKLSFALLIMTTVLFTAIFLSNTFYQIDIGSIKYDYALTATTASSVEPTNAEFVNALYESVENKEIYPEKFYITHSVNTRNVYVETSKLEKESIQAYQKATRVAYEEQEWETNQVSKIFFLQQVLDKTQQKELQKLSNTTFSGLENGGVILVLEENSSASELFKNFKVGDYVYFGENVKEPIVKIITYPTDTKYDATYASYNNFERCLYMDYDYYQEQYGADSISDYIQLTLENDATSSKTTVVLEKLLTKYDIHYKYTNMVETRKECKIISFILESLLYPLFVMLFIISVININNVLIGNVELKRGDISILKSVGMNTMQLYGFIAYEYLEGYITASFLALAIFIPLCIIENYLGLTSAFKLGENLFSTLIISILIMDTLIVTGLVVLSLRSLKEIDAIENMKNIT